jgi:hypothetical protein
VGGSLSAGLLIVLASVSLRRRRAARFASDLSRTSVYSDSHPGGKSAISETNEKLFPYGNVTDSGLHLQRLATPESQIVTVAGPQYSFLPYSTF